MPDSDSCARAARAAIEVVREECSGADVEIRELEDGMFMEIPTEDAHLIDNAANSPVPLDNFSNVIEQSGFLRAWLSGTVEAEDVEVDPNSQSYAERVFTFAQSIFDEPLDFTATDLVGTSVLESIAAE